MTEDIKTEKPKEENKKKSHTKIEVNMRIIPKIDLGIRAVDARISKSRQWTRDSKIIGGVKKDGDDYGILAFREGTWKAKNPLNRKLVIKLFTMSEYWRGSIEMLQGESVMTSRAHRRSCAAYSCLIDKTSILIKIHQFRASILRGEIFGLDLVDEDRVHNAYVIDDIRLTLGSDWKVKDLSGRKVAKIDGKLFSFGGKYVINIYDEDLANDAQFFTTLILFAATLKYKNDVKKTIKSTLKAIKKGAKLKLRKGESDLYLNPRMLRY